MTDAITAQEMRDIERAAIESGDVTGLELMERAGLGVVEAVFKEWPELAEGVHAATVFCGPGNNGGDGFVIARILKATGWDVAVYFYGNPNRLPPDALTNRDLWTKLGGNITVLEPHSFDFRWAKSGIIVDALFGIGLSRPIPELTTLLWNIADAADINSDPALMRSPDFLAPFVVAVDIPSGVDADTGLTLGDGVSGCEAATANLTVTFHKLKMGHILAEGPDHCGKVVVKDIGL